MMANISETAIALKCQGALHAIAVPGAIRVIFRDPFPQMKRFSTPPNRDFFSVWEVFWQWFYDPSSSTHFGGGTDRSYICHHFWLCGGFCDCCTRSYQSDFSRPAPANEEILDPTQPRFFFNLGGFLAMILSPPPPSPPTLEGALTGHISVINFDFAEDFACGLYDFILECRWQCLSIVLPDIAYGLSFGELRVKHVFENWCKWELVQIVTTAE